jgi:hypothetical protein
LKLLPDNQTQYEGLIFSFAEMEKEIENLRLLAKPFLHEESFDRVIPAWKQDLYNFRSARTNSAHVWKIPLEDPIKTKLSDGAYERGGRRGSLRVFGTVSGAWEIRHLPGKRKSSPTSSFLLFGLASIKLSIRCIQGNEQEEEIACWSVDIGDAASPGCHFHTQIQLNPESRMFPASLTVPRLPGILHTPMDALDFLLGELFQDEWYRRSSEDNDHTKNWASCQRGRLIALLDWHREEISKTTGSPWNGFKRTKPRKDLFIRTH